MPESIVRFLRFYASVVVLLVSAVVAFGVEPARTHDDFTKVATASRNVPGVRVSDPLLRSPSLRVLDALVSDPHVSVPSPANPSAVHPNAWTQPSANREAFDAKHCAQAPLRVRSES